MTKFGEGAKLVCSVQTSPDTETRVTWLFKGAEVQLDQGKYSTAVQKSVHEENVLEYLLQIDDTQEEDLGLYMCQLYSAYNLEDEHEVWVKQSTSESKHYVSLEKKLPTIIGADVNVKKQSSNQTTYFLLCIVLGAVACALGAWKCGLFAKKAKWNVGLGDLPQPGGKGYPYHPGSTGSGWGTNTATRRKLV